MRDEQSVYPEVLEQAQALTTLDRRPLVVITTTESQKKISGWTDAQIHLAELSTNSQHRVVEATHAGVVDDAQSFQPSVQAISDVVQAIRTREPVGDR